MTVMEEGHGWMGIRFQTEPHSAPSEILIHVRLIEKENVRQQEALGLIGVNLIHAAFYHRTDPAALIGSLLDNLTWERVEVDMIRCAGPAFAVCAAASADLTSLLSRFTSVGASGWSSQLAAFGPSWGCRATWRRIPGSQRCSRACVGARR